MVEPAKDLQNDDKRTAELGLSEDELAFYDILASKKDIFKEKEPI
jgi:type I restriction enzyme R subunit